MRNTIVLLGALTSSACGNKQPEAETETRKLAAQPAAIATRTDSTSGKASPKLFLDVHDVGPGKVTAEAVAQAHQKDLATEAKYGVDFKAYWFDEKAGKIYCLAEAPSADATTAVHKEAHGLVANEIREVTGDNLSWQPERGKKLYLDVHHLGAGKVTAADVAAAHAKDLAAQGPYDVKYLNYWFDAKTGTVMCLSEAPSEEAAIAVHREAHGLVPESIEEVAEGR
jgi:uncharacterized protein YcfL